jgi:glutathione S-transferase
MTLTLYGFKGSSALAPHIALEEAGATYDFAPVNTRDGSTRAPAFLKINPNGRVPALATPQGVLTENPAILAWIAQTHPQAGLAPTDAFAFARMQAFNSYLGSTVHVAHAHRHRGYRWADDETAWAAMTAKVAENITACFQLIEDSWLQGPWVMGDQYTVADGYLFTIADWLELDGVDPTRFPKAHAHRERVRARPAVARAMAKEAAAA